MWRAQSPGARWHRHYREPFERMVRNWQASQKGYLGLKGLTSLLDNELGLKTMTLQPQHLRAKQKVQPFRSGPEMHKSHRSSRRGDGSPGQGFLNGIRSDTQVRAGLPPLAGRGEVWKKHEDIPTLRPQDLPRRVHPAQVRGPKSKSPNETQSECHSKLS